MFRTIGKRLYRDRRRYAVVAALLFLSGALLYWGGAAGNGWLPPLMGGLAFLAIVGPLVVATCLLLPLIRHWAEVTTLALVLWLALRLVWPWFETWTALSNWAIAVFLVFAKVVGKIIHDDWFDGVLRRRNHNYSGHGWSRLPVEDLWPRLYTTPETKDVAALPFGEPIEVSWLDLPPHVRNVSRLPDGEAIEEHQLVQTLVPGRHVRFRYALVNGGRETDPKGGLSDLRLTPAKGRTRVDKTMIPDSSPWRTVLLSWIDDSYGRVIDEIIAKAEKMAAEGSEPPSPPASPWVQARAH